MRSLGVTSTPPESGAEHREGGCRGQPQIRVSRGFAPHGGQDGRIYRVQESGGASAPITELDSAKGDIAHLPSSFLPDGRRFVFGAQSGGAQLWIAPAKLGLGTLLSVLICLPSLYIFLCLGGIDAQLRNVCGALFAAVCLTSILLIGFAPVAWIFSQSTDSIAFMGALHLLFWVIGIRFGLRLIDATGRFLGARGKGHLRIWSFIFIMVCFQMTTTLRPIIAPSKTFLPTEKKFFLAHWFDSISGK